MNSLFHIVSVILLALHVSDFIWKKTWNEQLEFLRLVPMSSSLV